MKSRRMGKVYSVKRILFWNIIILRLFVSKGTRYEKIKSNDSVNFQEFSNDMYLRTVHNSKGVNDLYLVIRGPKKFYSAN